MSTQGLCGQQKTAVERGCNLPLLVLQSLPGPALTINGGGQCSFPCLGRQGLSSTVEVSCGTAECSLTDLGPEVSSGFAWVNRGRGGHRIPKVSPALDRLFMKEGSQLKHPNYPRPLRACFGRLWSRRAQLPWPGSPGNGRLWGSQTWKRGHSFPDLILHSWGDSHVKGGAACMVWHPRAWPALLSSSTEEHEKLLQPARPWRGQLRVDLVNDLVTFLLS